jgi:uncharacterized protein YndB with AHSA1/START domain
MGLEDLVGSSALRYGDCPTVETGVLVDAPAETVWRFVTDIQLPAQFSCEFLGAEWLDGADGPSVGARFIGHSHHPAAGEWETTCVVTELDPPRVFAYSVGDPLDPSSRWRFTLEPHGTGTIVTQWMQMGPARSGINLAIDAMPDKEDRILRRRLGEHRSNMEATLRGIKDAAEAGAS